PRPPGASSSLSSRPPAGQEAHYAQSQKAETIDATEEGARHRTGCLVRSQDVDPDRRVRSMIAADEVGQVDQMFWVGRAHCAHHTIDSPNIPGNGGPLRTNISEGVPGLEPWQAPFPRRATRSRPSRYPMKPVPPTTKTLLDASDFLKPPLDVSKSSPAAVQRCRTHVPYIRIPAE